MMNLKSIKMKILVVLITMACVLSLIFATVNVVSLMQMRNEIHERNSALGEVSSKKSAELLKEKTVDELMTNTAGICDYSAEMFLNAESQVLVIARFLESVYNDTNGIFTDKILSPYGILTQEEYDANLLENPRSPLLHIKADRTAWDKDNSSLTDAAQKELNLISAAAPLLTETTNTNNIFTACFIGSAEGFQFSADAASSQGSVNVTDFGGAEGVKGREWFKIAQNLKKGETAWTKIFLDNSGRGASLNIATPVYDSSGVLRAVVAGAGIVTDYGAVVTDATIGTTGKSFIVDNSGNIIITKDEIGFEDDLPKYENLADNGDEKIKAAMPKITGAENGYVVGKYKDVEILMAYSPIIAQPWSFVSIVDMQEVLAPALSLADTIKGNTNASIEALNKNINNTLWIIVAIMVFVLGVTVIFALKFARSLSAPITQLTQAVSNLGNGNLNTFIKIDTRDETRILADAFNQMSVDLRLHISNLAKVTAEKERIGAELSVATQIQASMLPCIFPAFPGRKEFDIFASMHPAKEVGGDFYDFFLIDDNHLAVVIADVSGKGVPAALFMVIAKTLIKNHAQMNKCAADVLTETNAQLCEGNDANLFVTAWLGILEICTGKFTYSNAGHNAPLIKRKGGRYEYLRDRAGFVLAGMEGVKYKQFETVLNKGDKLFLYTDGVTEATDKNNNLLGDDRLQSTVNSIPDADPKEILMAVSNDITNFVKGEQQFDDITMLCLKINE